jgi:hypothetical protein
MNKKKDELTDKEVEPNEKKEKIRPCDGLHGQKNAGELHYLMNRSSSIIELNRNLLPMSLMAFVDKAINSGDIQTVRAAEAAIVAYFEGGNHVWRPEGYIGDKCLERNADLDDEIPF